MKTKTPRFEQQQKIPKKKLFLPLFLGSIMIFSVFAIIFSSPNTSSPNDSSVLEYQGYTFRQQGTGWSTSVNGRTLNLRYNPVDVSSSFPDLDLSSLQNLFTASKIYLSFFPGEQIQLPLQELYNNLKPAYPQLFLTCVTEGPGCTDLPIKTCADATSSTAVLLLQSDPSSSPPTMTGTAMCFTLKGNERDLVILIDKLLLALAGL